MKLSEQGQLTWTGRNEINSELRIRPMVPGADDENPVKAMQIYLSLGFQVVRKILSCARAA